MVVTKVSSPTKWGRWPGAERRVGGGFSRNGNLSRNQPGTPLRRSRDDGFHQGDPFRLTTFGTFP